MPTSQPSMSFYEVSEAWEGKGFDQHPSSYGEILKQYDHRGEGEIQGGVGGWLWKNSVCGANLGDPEDEAAGDKKREGLP